MAASNASWIDKWHRRLRSDHAHDVVAWSQLAERYIATIVRRRHVPETGQAQPAADDGSPEDAQLDANRLVRPPSSLTVPLIEPYFQNLSVTPPRCSPSARMMAWLPVSEATCARAPSGAYPDRVARDRVGVHFGQSRKTNAPLASLMTRIGNRLSVAGGAPGTTARRPVELQRDLCAGDWFARRGVDGATEDEARRTWGSCLGTGRLLSTAGAVVTEHDQSKRPSQAKFRGHRTTSE